MQPTKCKGNSHGTTTKTGQSQTILTLTIYRKEYKYLWHQSSIITSRMHLFGVIDIIVTFSYKVGQT